MDKCERLYELTREQAEELVDRLPSHTKGQRKEIKGIYEGLDAMQDGEQVFVLEYVHKDEKHTVLFAWKQVAENEFHFRALCKEMAVSVTCKFLLMKHIPILFEDVKPDHVA